MSPRNTLLCGLLGLTLLSAPPLHAAPATPPPTLWQLAGAEPTTAHLGDSVLVIIDAQREYLDGALPLAGVEAAIDATAALLARARRAGTPVIHVVHHGGGALFNPEGPYFAIVPALAPRPDEVVIEKRLPNAFAGTELQATLAALGRQQLILTGFMTHMCLSSTTRAALDLGYRSTLVAEASATRDLPDGRGGTVSAAEVQRAALAALRDRFALVVERGAAIPE